MKSILAVCAVVACAGSALGQIESINGLNFNTYENFRNPGSVIPSSLTLNGGAPIPSVYNTSQAVPIGGPHTVREVYPRLTNGFANRHIMWFSNDGGATPYQLQSPSESFSISVCFRTTTNHVTGIGSPINSETGFWIHNPRVNEQGQSFTDEGGVWLITNGTSFSGGAGQDFFLFGEGGFNNPGSPPIYGNGELVEMTYTYYGPGHFNPGEGAKFEATVNNITRGVSVSSGLKNFNFIPGSGETGLNPGATFGFRIQNQVQASIDTDTTTEIFNISVGIPAPSSVALLGLAGLVAGRRRR